MLSWSASKFWISKPSVIDCSFSGSCGKMAKYTIVMVRHGESEWNQKNLFCGWYDANLSQKGKQV